jgi:hypothetical protein
MRTTAIATTVGLALAAQTVLAVDVKVDFDKMFDFKSVTTWGWNPKGAGDLRMARTADDDPDAMRAQVEPIIMATMREEMGKRGIQPASGPPGVTATYYLLVSTTQSSQTIGQFLPAAAMWGVPPYDGQTQSLEVMNQGSLVLDLSEGTNVEKLVWRGVARAKIRVGTERAQREKVLRESIRDLIKKIPSKK